MSVSTTLRRAPAVLAPLMLAFLVAAGPPARPAAAALTPAATLVPAPGLSLPGPVDSNSPVVWDLVDGKPQLWVMTSVAGQPSVAAGARLARMGAPETVQFVSHPGDGVWMESVIADTDGTWYGYYHNEVPAHMCRRTDLVMPRIGAARSTDRGLTWEDLGIVLEAPDGAVDCDTPNAFFVGGVGDVSVILDLESTTLYFFFSQYSPMPDAQGVAVARMLWANRDAPTGRIEVWSGGAWLPPRARESDASSATGWSYPAGTALAAPEHPWHDADSVTDAFWGASVHWNTFLQQYVMLLNRTLDEQFTQEGIYVSFAPTLDDPTRWSAPQRILAGGSWYPEVTGLEPGVGTDKVAGQRARFFMSGVSTRLIEFGYR